MKTLEERFNEIKVKHSEWGDVIIFSETVYNKNYPVKELKESFNKLVGKNEYEKSEKDEIIDFLVLHTKRKPRISISENNDFEDNLTVIL